MTHEHHHVLYHGNCTDGFASFALYYRWATARGHRVTGKPVAPHDPGTWPAVPSPSEGGPAIVTVFLDVLLPEESYRLWEAVSVRTLVIDHHSTSADLAARLVSATTQVVFSTEACAAVLTYQYLYPGASVPDWVWHVDRVDRWCDVTTHDVALREYLQPIARLPVVDSDGQAKALRHLDDFVACYSAGGPAMCDVINVADHLLGVKQRALNEILMRADMTARVVVEPSYCIAHLLDPRWDGQVVFSVDTTGVRGFDTTLAAHMVFQSCPEVTVFMNYIRIGKDRYKVCMRSKGFDVTVHTAGCHVLSGHPCAAGGVLGGKQVPFL